jgi:methylated-DNA-[protein]-cysteine S-methyltransferase
MEADGIAVFETALGACGIAWNSEGVAGVLLPEADRAKTEIKLRKRFPNAREETPPASISRVVAGIAALLRGDEANLNAVPVDMREVSGFNRAVYAIARSIPRGRTLTYGDVAARLGDLGASRAVGRALAENPFPLVVPCHRVVASDGTLGGFSAPGGVSTKRRLLALEGALIETPTLFDLT